MPRSPKAANPSGFKKDLKITDCKNCGWGVFEGQRWEWQAVTPVGIVHVDCEEHP